jgi:hypothetical protein
MAQDRKTIEAEVMDHAFYHGGNAPDLGWSAHDQDYCRPDREVIEREEDRMMEAIPEEYMSRLRSKERSHALMRMFDEVLSDFVRDGDPAGVGRKVLSVAKFCGHKAVDGYSLGELATAGMETKAAVSARIRKTCNQPIEAVDGIAQARFQQGPQQRAVSAEAQKGNKNRAGNKK